MSTWVQVDMLVPETSIGEAARSVSHTLMRLGYEVMVNDGKVVAADVECIVQTTELVAEQ